MPITMSLREAIARRKDLELAGATEDEDGEAPPLTIYARKPWGADAECVVERHAEGARLRQDLLAQGYAYFLELSVLEEVLDVAVARRVSLDERVRVATYYAEHDAWPEDHP